MLCLLIPFKAEEKVIGGKRMRLLSEGFGIILTQTLFHIVVDRGHVSLIAT